MTLVGSVELEEILEERPALPLLVVPLAAAAIVVVMAVAVVIPGSRRSS
jgi:hypothetical protein